MFIQHFPAPSSSWPHLTPQVQSSLLLNGGRGGSRNSQRQGWGTSSWRKLSPFLPTQGSGEGLAKQGASGLLAGENQTGGGLMSARGPPRTAPQDSVPPTWRMTCPRTLGANNAGFTVQN